MPHTTQIVQRLYTDGRCDETPCWMTLAEMQAFVGGYIELVKTRTPHRLLVINEEGMLDDLPYNAVATALTHPDVYMLDGIRGPALLIKG